MKLIIKTTLLLFLLFSVHAKTINIPEINGTLHNFNQHQGDFKLELVLSCHETHILSWMKVVSKSCGEKIIEAKLVKDGHNLKYKFETDEFKFRVKRRFRVKFDRLEIRVRINDSKHSSPFLRDKVLIKDQFANKTKIDMDGLKESLSDISLYVLNKQPINFINEDGSPAIKRIKKMYKDVDVIRVNLDIVHDQHEEDEESSDFEPYGVTTKAWTGEDRTIETASLSKIMWVFSGYVNKLEVNIKQDIRLETKERGNNTQNLIKQELTIIYPNKYKDQYPSNLSEIVVTDEWQHY